MILLTGMILIDLQKAFDTINNDILLRKMSALRFSDRSINWFQSYLSNRSFRVNVQGKCSCIAKIDCGVHQGSILGPLLFLLYVNDMKQAVDCDLFLSADDSCLVYQHKDVKEIEKNLNKNFLNVFDWFVDNKLSIHFGEDKTKCILFGRKHRLNKVNSLEIKYGEIHIKQYHTVTYLVCLLDETLSGESMALKVINKINTRLRFLYRKNKFLSPPLRRLLCNSLIQPHFDYACSAWYPNLNKILKSKLQILQNECIRLCLNLNNKAHIGQKEFEQINWLNVNDRFKLIISSMSFKFCNNTSPPYMNVFKPAGQPNTTTRASLLKLNQPLRRTNHGQNNISYIALIIWNNLPNSLKTTDSLNTYIQT